MKRLTMSNGDVLDNPLAGLKLDCTECPGETDPERRADDPVSVVRCCTCGTKHRTDSVEFVGDA